MSQLVILKPNFANKQKYNGRGSGNVYHAWDGFRRLCARFVGAYPTCHLAVRLKALLLNTPQHQVNSKLQQKIQRNILNSRGWVDRSR